MYLWYGNNNFMLFFVRKNFDLCFIIKIARIAQTKGGCGLKIPVDVPRNEPVYLVQHQHNNFSLFKPSGETNTFSSNGNLFAFCAGKKNSIQIEQHPINSNLTEITCSNANFLVSEFGDVGNLNKINCTKGVQADISVKKRQTCSSKGHIIDVGFKLTNKVFLPTFTICFDNTSWTPIWSKHVINGKSIKFNVKENGRREFKAIGLPTNARPSDAYKKVTQILHFTELLGTAQTETYFSSNSFLARGHLTPDADFVFPSAQWSTYFYLNTCPQFQTVNAGNWLGVENLARKLAQHYDVEMEIFTGGYDNLKLENAAGDLKSMYLTTR
ncbi:hypothetical protein HA402_004597 [Bradysia odoriphaga]|nr:hypothetical protein HA402_004597 [Bradysia odoriphaga]